MSNSSGVTMFDSTLAATLTDDQHEMLDWLAINAPTRIEQIGGQWYIIDDAECFCGPWASEADAIEADRIGQISAVLGG